MTIWKAPVDSFFNVNFYKEVQKYSLGTGFFYLLYLTGITAFLFLILLGVRFLPLADNFVEWFKQEMPSVMWSPEKVQIRETTPFTMFHPEYGPFIVFQTEQTDLNLTDLQGAPVHVTSNKVYIRGGQGEVRVYDLTDPTLQDPRVQGPVAIGPAFVQQYYDMIKPWLYVITFFLYVPLFFVWKLFVAVLYSLIAMIINQFRAEKLSYGKLYTICLFAITPATLISSIQPILPGINAIPFGALGSILVTILYLFVAVKMTETPPPLPAQ